MCCPLMLQKFITTVISIIMFLMTSLYLVLTSIPILVTLQQPTCHFYPRPHSEDLSSAKATRLLNFIRRNLYNSSKEIKSRAYTLL